MRLDSLMLIGLTICMLGACDVQQTESHEREVEKLLALDVAWSAAELEEQITFLTDDAIYLAEGMPQVIGRDAIAEIWREEARLPGFSIKWDPDGAVVSASGDVGYTYGPNKTTLNDATGAITIIKGKYVTIWRRQPDQSWKVAVDIWNSDGTPDL